MDKQPDPSEQVGDVPSTVPVKAPAVGSTERLGRALVLGVAASLALALLATQLLAPGRRSGPPGGAAASDRGSSHAPAASSSNPGSEHVAPSPLPDFKVFGGPQPAGRLLLNGEGPRLVDLATGALKVP